jgi:leader peptidase (prepilin peptidase)/N-methyltransferase
MHDPLWWLLLIWCGLFGLTLGSFLNVVIYRLPRKCESIARGRSFCPRCLKQIAWYDNIPVLSYIVLRGKCRRCGGRISPRYVLVELLTGGMFLYLAHKFLLANSGEEVITDKWPLFFIYGGLIAAMIACSFIDLRLRIIPDEIDKSLILIGMAISFIYPRLHEPATRNFVWKEQILQWPLGDRFLALFSSVFGILVGAGVIYVAGVVGKALFRKEAMGGGDLKFMAMIGAFLGWNMTLLTFLLACLSGAVIGVVVLATTKDHYMPFGPFLALGAAVVIFFHDLIFAAMAWYMNVLSGTT